MEENAVILFSTEMLLRLFGMLLTIVVARKLGAADFGLLEFAYALAGTALIVLNPGLNDFTVRELAKRPARAGLLLFNMSVIRECSTSRPFYSLSAM